MLRSIALLVCLLLAGCASFSTVDARQVAIGNSTVLQLLAPTEELSERVLTQLVTFRYGTHQDSLLITIEFVDKDLTAVAITPHGIPVFELTYTQAGLLNVEKYIELEAVDPRFIVADLQLSLWPLSMLNAAIDNGEVHENIAANGEKKRWVSLQDEVILDIDYQSDSLVFTHHQRGYQITVKNIE